MSRTAKEAIELGNKAKMVEGMHLLVTMLNEKTGIANSTLYGTIILSSNPADYGDTAAEEDIEVYRKYITDHAPHADVIMGASYEAGYDPDDSDDDLEQEEGDEWLESMWARYPEHEAKYR